MYKCIQDVPDHAGVGVGFNGISFPDTRVISVSYSREGYVSKISLALEFRDGGLVGLVEAMRNTRAGTLDVLGQTWVMSGIISFSVNFVSDVITIEVVYV